FPELLRLLEEQPPWSDLPIIVLVSLGSSDPELSRILASLDEHANTTILERPVRLETLVHAAESALRSRGRQYEFREHLEARVRAEAAERRARSEAEDALRAREEFLSIASHELRNPVAALNGTAQLLMRARGAG